MTFGLPLSSEVWRFFLEDHGEFDRDCCVSGSFLDWEWIWLKQVASLPREGLDLSDPYKPVVQFNLRCEEYWIALSPGAAFPSQSPIVKCAYQHGFYFHWRTAENFGAQASTLTDIVKSYHDYCGMIDVAISEIKLLENHLFTLSGYSLHDEDTECFTVQLRPKFAAEETITVHVDWRSPFDFPRFISSTDEQRFLNLDCDVWDVSEDLCTNLQKIIKQLHHGDSQ